MKYLAHAPMRLGLAGGGTDLASYADEHGGAVVNVTISRFAHASVEPAHDGYTTFRSRDFGTTSRFPTGRSPARPDECSLQLATLRRVAEMLDISDTAITLTTWVDAPPGSGLGSSSALTVAIVAALCQWQGVQLEPPALAELAYQIEYLDLDNSCGRQDQYAAACGGLNFMEFSRDSVSVTPLHISSSALAALESRLLLFDTGTTRPSATVLSDQVERVESNHISTLEAMHDLRQLAYQLRGAIVAGDVVELGQVLDYGMQRKLRSSPRVGSNGIATLYQQARDLGADGGKVSGAGGGGFMLLSCPVEARQAVMGLMKASGCILQDVRFEAAGVRSWKLDDVDQP